MNKKKKPSMLRILITLDVGVILVIFTLLAVFFNTTIAQLIINTAEDSMIARSLRIETSIMEAYGYLNEKEEIATPQVYRQVHENIMNIGLNELEYDQSLTVMIFDNELIGGSRINRGDGVDRDGLGKFLMESTGDGPFELSELTTHLLSLDDHIALMRFDYSRLDYIGTVHLIDLGDSSILLILGDRTGDFFSQLHGIRNLFLTFIGIALILILIIKIINTRSATKEIVVIRNQLQAQGDAIQRDGLVHDTEDTEEYHFLDTNDLASSFQYLNGRIVSLGDIIGGIADPDLFRAALRDDKSVLDPHEENMAIMFLDVQGFTTISEKYESKAMDIINIIWDRVQTCIENNGGKLNKFMGDACLVIFPQTDGESPSFRALESALELFRSLPELEQETATTNFTFRIGIDYGSVVYGKTGSNKKYELGVIGDSVNTAARLESLNKQYTTNLLFTGAALENAGFSSDQIKRDGIIGAFSSCPQFNSDENQYHIFKIDAARPKGKRVATNIFSFLIKAPSSIEDYSLLGSPSIFKGELFKRHQEFLLGYEQGLESWKEDDVDEAEKFWKSLAHNWALLNSKYGFLLAGMFIERFVTPENFLVYKKQPNEWIKSRSVEIDAPSEDWIETGFYELKK